MKVLSFDLSTVCIGVLAAEIDDLSGKILLVKSAPIIPPKFDVSTLGFRKSKKKVQTPNSKKMVNAWIKENEETVSEAEKKKRDVFVREEQNKFLLSELSASMGNLIEVIQPDLINIEQNAIFNGILTTTLLAKLSGTLIGIAGSSGIPFNQYKVSTVRKRHTPAKLVSDFAKRHNKEYIRSLPDVTKAALREAMQEKYSKYGLELHTDDEGDACVVFDYWYEEVYLKERKHDTVNPVARSRC